MPPRIRHTKQRQAVLRTVKLSAVPLDAETVHRTVRRVFPSVSFMTVYRNLNFLTKRGEVYQVDGEDGVKRYVGHSFHEIRFRCQRCGRVRKLPSETLQAYVDKKMWGQQTVFFSRLTAQGLCASCLRLLHMSKGA